MLTLTKMMSIAATAALFAAPAAYAGNMKDKAETAVENSSMTLVSEVQAEVRGALERGDYIIVEGQDGRIYYNRVIPVSELPDPTLDIEESETYTFEHDGVTYTNKIVQDVG